MRGSQEFTEWPTSIDGLEIKTRAYLKSKRAYSVRPGNPIVDVKFPCVVAYHDDGHYPFTDFATVRLVWARAQELARLCGVRRIYAIEHEGADFAGMSTFPKDYASDTLAEERGYCALLRWKLTRYDGVFLGKSNHLDRPTKHYTREAQTSDQREYNSKTHRGPLEELADEHGGLVRVNSPVVQVGDAVYCHFDDFLPLPGSTARRVAEHIGANGYWRGVKEPVRAGRTGHTHGIWEGEIFGTTATWAEVGCGTYIQPYVAKNTKIKGYGRKPWFNAAMLDVFDKTGRLVLDRSQLLKIGLARLPEIEEVKGE